METPYLTHITEDDYLNVYEPAEDSFLLIDALESELPSLQQRKPSVCVEVGPGSGVVITAVAKALNADNLTTACFAVDINKHACKITQKTAKMNSAKLVEIITMDLLASFKPKSIDVLIFNPPYVLTPDNEIHLKTDNAKSDINADIIKSWAGGSDGRQIIDKLFLQLSSKLADNGCFYLLVIKDNNPVKIMSDLSEINFQSKVIAERKIRGEHLYILKIEKE